MIEPTINDAVRAIHTNAVTIWGDNLNDLVVHDVNGNTITIDLSVVTAELTTLQTQYAEQQQAQANAKASALAKLAALGLTQAEVSAILGA
jgi:hypothetical protein